MQEKTDAPVIAVVGLSDVGQAIAAALQGVKTTYELVGHDPERDRAKAALAAGRIDRADWSLANVAAAADILVIAEPLDTTLETLGAVAPHLKDGALVTDTASVKEPVMALAAATLPPTATFVGGHPIIRAPQGDEVASLEGATWCLVTPAGADEEAADTMTRLVAAVGADPYYISAEEHDALAIGLGPLAYVLAGAALKAVGASPSVRDLRRLAPPELQDAFDADRDTSAAVRVLTDHPEAALPWLRSLTADLDALGDAVAEGRRDEVAAFFEELEAARRAWDEASALDQEERSAAFEDLDERSTALDTLFGRSFARRIRGHGRDG